MKTEDYAKAMRLSLCNEEVRDKEGNLNHVYFLSKKNSYWGVSQQKAMLEALGKYELGNWAQFKSLPALQKFYDIELELRACMLLKVKDLGGLTGKKISTESLLSLQSK